MRGEAGIWDGDAQIEQLAREMLEQARETIAMTFRYLDVALWHMPFRPLTLDAPLATDGTTLFFDPVRVIARFRESPDALVRDYLHVVLHCVFRQPFQVGFPDRRAWMRSCDITAELTAWEMSRPRFACTHDFELEDLFATLKRSLGAITPKKVYRELVAYERAEGPSVFDGLPSDVVTSWVEKVTVRDSHVAWYRDEHDDIADDDVDGEPGVELREATSISDVIGGQGEDGHVVSRADDADGDDGADDAGSADSGSGDSAESPRDVRDERHSFRSETNRNAAQDEWEGIYRQIEMEMRTAALEEADTPGMLVAQIQLAARKPIDYAAFLRSFASFEEDMRVNDEEFDYIYYTLGLDMFGNMPLVDPLEYQEVNCVREFVIAIDTSASCKGELVTAFLTRTCEILESTALFGHDVNLHIIQCDARVQDDIVITSLDQLGGVASTMQVKGLGGTDFRPVFEHVDALVERGDFENLRGLIYFTDGMGTYPERMPAYDTAFVFLEEEGIPVRVPPWAMKVVLDEDGIRAL